MMKIQLKPEQEKFINEQITKGKFNSPEELIEKMFLVFERAQGNYEEWLKETKVKIEEWMESLERGEGEDGDLVINRLREKITQIKQNQ